MLVQGDKIVSLGPTGAAPPEGAVVISGAGRTLLPGLIDAHVHVTGAPGTPWEMVAPDPALNLASWLYAGVTTVYDMGGSPSALSELASKVDTFAIPGPRIVHTAGQITVPDGHPVGMIRALAPWPISAAIIAGVPVVRGPEDAEGVVAKICAEPGVTFVKAMRDRDLPTDPEMDDATLRAVVVAAHAHQRKIAVHVGTEADALAAVRAGADVLAHMVYRGPVSDAAAEEIAAAKVPVLTTWVAFEHIAQLGAGTRVPTVWDRALLPEKFLNRVTADSKAEIAKDPTLAALIGGVSPHQSLWRANIETLARAHVTLLAGTDAVLPAHFPGGSLHEELALLHSAGIPNAEVLLDATSRSAGLWGPADYGTVEVGKAADLLLVEGDPVADLSALEHIAAVIKGGRRVLRRE